MSRLDYKYGLRTVAVLEAAKGVAVVALCAVLLTLLHKDLDVVVVHLTHWLRRTPTQGLRTGFMTWRDHGTRHLGGGDGWAGVLGVPFCGGLRTVERAPLGGVVCLISARSMCDRGVRGDCASSLVQAAGAGGQYCGVLVRLLRILLENNRRERCQLERKRPPRRRMSPRGSPSRVETVAAAD